MKTKILAAWPTTSTILAIPIMKGYKITFSAVEIRKWDCVELKVAKSRNV